MTARRRFSPHTGTGPQSILHSVGGFGGILTSVEGSMTSPPWETLCAICLKRIPPGMGAFRRGATYVHVRCADRPEKTPLRRPKTTGG